MSRPLGTPQAEVKSHLSARPKAKWNHHLSAMVKWNHTNIRAVFPQAKVCLPVIKYAYNFNRIKQSIH